MSRRQMSKRKRDLIKAGIIPQREKRSKNSLCPISGKISIRTAGEADKRLSEFILSASRGQHMPIRYYKCDCGYYHLTSKVYSPKDKTKDDPNLKLGVVPKPSIMPKHKAVSHSKQYV